MIYLSKHREIQGKLFMSEECDTFWINLAEKFFGLILLIIGAILMYYTVTSSSEFGPFTWFFGVVCGVMLLIGLFLLLVRAPE